MTKHIHLCILVAAGIFASQGVATGSIQEVGDLNIINMVGNPSNGLRFLDMSYSVGLSEVDALANAQSTYANARLATPSEFDDLFSAAGISYSFSFTASDGFTPGLTRPLSVGVDYDGGELRNQLGITFTTDTTLIWTAPDGDGSSVTSRDRLLLNSEAAFIINVAQSPASFTSGWLLVSEPAPSNSAIPEPSSVLCWLGLVLMGWIKLPRNRKT